MSRLTMPVLVIVSRSIFKDVIEKHFLPLSLENLVKILISFHNTLYDSSEVIDLRVP